MAVRVYFNNSEPCTIRPSPLCSISRNILKNGGGEAFGVTYNITLNGTLIADQGTPYAVDEIFGRYPFHPLDGSPNPVPDSIGPYGAFDSNISHTDNIRPPKQAINNLTAMRAIFAKQKALSALFSKDGQKLEITDFETDLPAIICYPRLVSIDFQEGVYVDKCDYTINLECDVLLNQGLEVDADGTLVLNNNTIKFNETENALIETYNAAFINDFTEEWSLEVDEGVPESIYNPRSYRITHSLNATGKKHYNEVEIIPAWQQAKKFVLKKLKEQALPNNYVNYPNILGKIGSGTLDLISTYKGFNHVKTEQVGVSNGTYAVTETWILSTGIAFENYNLSLSSSSDNPYVSVSIDGNIKGLSEYPASGIVGPIPGLKNAYENSLIKYNSITNSGAFGITSDVYKRANNAVAVQLNSQPRSISVGSSPITGEITYNLQFDNRPRNIISGVLAESIQINDTYPGDVFAVIPVIGRPTGPILQYIGGRTEYRRELTINLTLDYTKIPYGDKRDTILLQKPSLMWPISQQLSDLIAEVSPAKEPGIRKYFIAPPTEQWNPKEGTYNITLTWTYELDK